MCVYDGCASVVCRDTHDGSAFLKFVCMHITCLTHSSNITLTEEDQDILALCLTMLNSCAICAVNKCHDQITSTSQVI